MNEIKNGIFGENPLFVQLLGVCPALATTTSLKNALGMGVAFTLVLICSNLIISSLKAVIPSQIRIPSYIVVIASLVTVIEMLMQAFVPDIYSSLGIFIPLIVVNCIVLGRAEAFASKNGLVKSFLDAIGMGIGFSLALCIIGAVREFLGTGKILDIPIYAGIIPTPLIFVLPAGAFITMGFVFALINYINQRKEASHG